MTDNTSQVPETPRPSRLNFIKVLRNRLLTGVIVVLPIVVTLWGITRFVQFFDNQLTKILPAELNPRINFGSWGFNLLDIPGLGLIVAVIMLIVIGILASNFMGKAFIKSGERLLSRVPVVRNIYNFIKQITNTVAQQSDRTFKEVCLLEYPRKGLHAIGFVTAELTGAPAEHLKKDYVCVFVPTTPNPTSGFLLFMKRSEITILDMTPEEGAKMIISGGMVSSNEDLVVEEVKPPRIRKKKKTGPQPGL